MTATYGWAAPLHDGDTIETPDGWIFTVTFENDCYFGAPWDNDCGHGPVSDWTMRAKRPGELIIATDGRSRRYYDFAEACRIAKRDGWNAEPYDIAGETRGQQAARAAMADYERLRQWCDDQWSYIGVIVTASRNGITLGSASLWGIESDAGDCLATIANELNDDALTEARATLASLSE